MWFDSAPHVSKNKRLIAPVFETGRMHERTCGVPTSPQQVGSREMAKKLRKPDPILWPGNQNPVNYILALQYRGRCVKPAKSEQPSYSELRPEKNVLDLSYVQVV